MRHPEFPVVSFLVIPLLLSSLPSHIRARSVAVIALVAWLVILNLIRGINSVIWANNVTIRFEVWCDIATKTLIGFTIAVPLSALCICRHLEHVSSNRQAIITRNDKRRRMKFEVIMCFGLPAIFMALHYVVQGHRFDIIEDVGCSPSTYFSIPAVMLIWVPPLLISLVTLIYAVAAFRHFLQRRIEFAALLRSSNSALSPGRYFRLMALAIFEIFWDSGTNIYILYFNTFSGLRPWISWENVHSNFSRVAVFPQFLMPPWSITQLIWQWWIIPISSIAFFLFFGFGEEAMSDYRAAIYWFLRAIPGRNRKLSRTTNTPALPTQRPAAPGKITVALPAKSEVISEHDSKAWDEISLNLSEIVEPTPFSAGADTGVIATYHMSEYLAARAPQNYAESDSNGSRSPWIGSESSTSLEDSQSLPSPSVRDSMAHALGRTDSAPHQRIATPCVAFAGTETDILGERDQFHHASQHAATNASIAYIHDLTFSR